VLIAQIFDRGRFILISAVKRFKNRGSVESLTWDMIMRLLLADKLNLVKEDKTQ
jgi:hypothetical protein